MEIRSFKVYRANYAERFACLAADCPDCCCGNWKISVDRVAYERLSSLTDSPLFPIIQSAILSVDPPADAANVNPQEVATIQLLEDGSCPLLNEEKLCRIHIEHGAEALPQICRKYPRASHKIYGIEETVLTLSCLEVARIVLSDPDLSKSIWDGTLLELKGEDNTQASLHNCYWAFRAIVLELLLNRRYLLWQRIFLVGLFARRLESISQGKEIVGLMGFMKEFTNAIQAEPLRAQLDSIQPDVATQFRVFRQLVALRAGEGKTSESAAHLIEGLNSSLLNNSLKDDSLEAIEQYNAAWKLYTEPFFAQHPYFLENYLINQIFLKLFPFHVDYFKQDSLPIQPMRSLAGLVMNFVLIKGVMTAIAAQRKQALDMHSAIEIVRLLAHAFEHSDSFQLKVEKLFLDHDLGSSPGLAMLLMN